MQGHDALYTPIKRATGPVREAIEQATTVAVRNAARRTVSENFDTNTALSMRCRHQRALAELRNLLENGAKERALQNALVESGLLALNCRVIQEVTMNPTDNYRGMRMDLVLDPMTDEPVQIVELKRGSLLLLARRGKPTERLAQQLRRAVEQLEGYGNRVDSDAATTIDLERHGLRFEKPELRLIAGRRLSDAHEYHLLSRVETDASDSNLQLQIYTWDGFLAELERIVD